MTGLFRSFLGLGVSYVEVNVFQNTLNVHLKSVHFTACKLLLNEINGKRPSKAVPCHGFGTLISLCPISCLSGSYHAASPCLLSHSEEPFVRCEQSPAQDGKLKSPGQIHSPLPMYANTVLWEHPHSHQLQRPLVHKLEISTLSLSRKSLPQLGLKDPFSLELFA